MRCDERPCKGPFFLYRMYKRHAYSSHPTCTDVQMPRCQGRQGAAWLSHGTTLLHHPDAVVHAKLPALHRQPSWQLSRRPWTAGSDVHGGTSCRRFSIIVIAPAGELPCSLPRCDQQAPLRGQTRRRTDAHERPWMSRSSIYRPMPFTPSLPITGKGPFISLKATLERRAEAP